MTSRTGSANDYSAVFTDASRLKAGDTVRVAGIRVGTVTGGVAAGRQDGAGEVRRRPQHRADHRHQGRGALPQPGRATATSNSSTPRIDEDRCPAGAQIPEDRTAPALDLDLLLGGLKPVIQGLNPEDVNALTSSLIQILQGQGGTLESLFSKTSSFTNSLADNNQVIEQLIDDLRTVLATLSKDGDEFSGAIDQLEQLVNGLAADRDPIGDAITRWTTAPPRSPTCSAAAGRRWRAPSTS